MRIDVLEMRFSYDEMTAYLRAWGYRIGEKKITLSRPIHHNDVEFYDVNADIVLVKGVDGWSEVTTSDFILRNNGAVKDVFNRELKQRLFRSLTT
jgi:hypothetical protein